MRNTIFAALALSTVSSVALAQTSTAPATPNTMNKTDSSAKPADATNTTGANNAAGTNNTGTDKPANNNNAANNNAMDNKKSSADTTGMKTDGTMGLRVAKAATVAVKYVAVSPAHFTTSNLLGATVYNNQKETVGEVEDLVIDNGKRVTGVVISVGGFLGMGESYVVVDPATLVLNRQDGDWAAYVDTTKETLKNAPKFTYPNSRS